MGEQSLGLPSGMSELQVRDVSLAVAGKSIMYEWSVMGKLMPPDGKESVRKFDILLDRKGHVGSRF